MVVRHRDPNLDRLEVDATYTAGCAPAIVKRFRKVMQIITDAPNERVFYGLRSLRFEKLKGNRSHQYSMRLNDQWRLIVEFEGKGDQKVVVVVGIEDYH